jgi:hypothetical protein
MSTLRLRPLLQAIDSELYETLPDTTRIAPSADGIEGLLRARAAPAKRRRDDTTGPVNNQDDEDQRILCLGRLIHWN